MMKFKCINHCMSAIYSSIYNIFRPIKCSYYLEQLAIKNCSMNNFLLFFYIHSNQQKLQKLCKSRFCMLICGTNFAQKKPNKEQLDLQNNVSGKNIKITLTLILKGLHRLAMHIVQPSQKLKSPNCCRSPRCGKYIKIWISSSSF